MDITITEEQRRYILGIIDKCCSFHRQLHNSYCKYPNKMNEQTCNSNCDECFDTYYEEMKAKMIRKAGLEG